MADELASDVKKQLIALIDGGQAHATFEDAVDGFPEELRGAVVAGVPYSAWQILEHMRIAQHDILDFCAPPTGGYHAPDQYWPKDPVPRSPDSWTYSVAAVQADREAFKKLLLRPEADLAKPFRWGTGQNLLREALLIADHMSYHTGELIVIRRVLGCWKS
jgi:hypothetical protein